MSPCKKIMFPNADEAAAYIKWARRRKGYDRFPIGIRIYRCDRCGGWHFTRQQVWSGGK